jgi:hypothetical protein
MLNSIACFQCVDCASPGGSRQFATFERTSAASGELWWLTGRGEIWTLDDGVALMVVTTTPSLTALRVPDDIRIGRHVVTVDGEREVDVSRERTALSPLPAEQLVLSNGMLKKTIWCVSSCGLSLENSGYEVLMFTWDKTLPSDQRALVVADIWESSDDIDDELAPREADSVAIPLDWISDDNQLTVLAKDGQEAMTIRLRSIVDGSVGPKVRAE